MNQLISRPPSQSDKTKLMPPVLDEVER